jgi:signal transduction histidine kinase
MQSKVSFGKTRIALREETRMPTQALLEATLSSVDVGVMVTDLDHVALAVNGRFGQIWQVTPDDVVRSSVHEVRNMVAHRIPDLTEWARNLEQVYADSAHVQEDELSLIDPAMTVRRFTGPVRDENGTIVGRIWTFLDISAEARRRRMREVLLEANAMFSQRPREIYDRLVALLADHYGSLALLSVSGEDRLEFLSAHGPGHELARQMGGNRFEDSYCQFCLAENAPVVIQNGAEDPRTVGVLPARIGLTRYLGVPVQNPSGTVLGTLCILDGRSNERFDEEDVLFFRQLAVRIGSEIERERALEALERELKRTTDELLAAQEGIVHREKLAVTGTLAASVAHDIRNILSAISLELVMGEQEPDRAIVAVRGHLDRFSVLSHRLLSYAKPKQVVREAVSARESLHRVLLLLGRQFELQRIQVELDVPADLPPIWADPSRLDHLFINLLLNAAQAMHGSGLLRIAATAGGEATRLQIADSGPGMTPEQVEAMFMPFRSDRKDGFGLGLYSAKRIAEESGIAVHVLTAPGSGTTFELVWHHSAEENAS